MENFNSKLFERAKKVMVGGVNSPVRAFGYVGGEPLFIKRASQQYMWDENGNKYIDLINSWGPMIMGHAWEKAVTNITNELKNSFSFGATCKYEVELAELITSSIKNVEKIRMVNSGTEACMTAVRLARGYTNREKIIKFEGHYHGHYDSFLVKAGSGLATLGTSTSSGLLKEVVNNTLVAEFNNLESIEKIINKNKENIAAIILEPVCGNMGCVLPEKGFLNAIREITKKNGIILIFDEVMTGFRLAFGGAQELFNIEADLVTYGKIIGGGFPVGAIGGKSEIMNHLAPIGKVYQAGTLSGNPIAMISGLTLLKELKEKPEIYNKLNMMSEKLSIGLENIFKNGKIDVTINQIGSMLSIFFTKEKIKNYSNLVNINKELFNKYFHFCLENGIYLPPSPYESLFISNAINEKDIEKIIFTSEKFCKFV